MPLNKRLKILYVITKGNWGGAQRYVFDMATNTKLRGFDVAVAFGDPGELGVRLEASGVKTIPIPTLARDVSLKRDLDSYRELRNIIKREKPDILHLNSSKIGVMGTIAGRIGGVPKIVFTAHGWAYNEERSWWQKLLIKGMYYSTVLLAHHTIAVSHATKRDAEWMLFISKKISVIHNGVARSIVRERSEARGILPGGDSKYWIGIIAELHPIKRIGDAILAFKEVQKKFADTILVIMGEGTERINLEALIRKEKLEEKVFLLGFVANASSYLSAFDIFLLPSKSEGVAYVLLEAGSVGIPVVTTKVGGIPEVIEDRRTGLLVPPKNPGAIEVALLKLLENPTLRESLGVKLKEKVEKEYSLERMVGETIDFYLSES